MAETGPTQTRGERVRVVREEAGWDQREFVERLNTRARELSLPAEYDIVKLSKMENNKRDVNLDDAYLVADLDPKSRGLAWLMGVRKVASRSVRPPNNKRASEGGSK